MIGEEFVLVRSAYEMLTSTRNRKTLPSAASTIRSTYEIPFYIYIFFHPQSKLCPIPSAASTICILCTYPIAAISVFFPSQYAAFKIYRP
jgi:hypothetical protein